MGVALLPAELTSLVIETVLAGISFVFFGVAVFVLKSKRGLFRSFDQVVFIVAHLLLFAIIAVSVLRLLRRTTDVDGYFSALDRWHQSCL